MSIESFTSVSEVETENVVLRMPESIQSLLDEAPNLTGQELCELNLELQPIIMEGLPYRDENLGRLQTELTKLKAKHPEDAYEKRQLQKAIKKTSALLDAEENKLWRLLEEEDPSERQRMKQLAEKSRNAEHDMVLANLRLVKIMVYGKYKRPGMKVLRDRLPTIASISDEDLWQEGVIGLIQGARTWDVREGYSFSTHAMGYIAQAITRKLEEAEIVRTPFGKQSIQRAALNVQILGYPLPIDENVTQREQITIENLDVAIGSDDPDVYTGKISEKTDGIRLFSYEDDVDHIVTRYKTTDLQAIIKNELTERQVSAVELRFGLKDGRTRNQAEVARELGITRQMVSLHLKAVHKILAEAITLE